MSDRVMAFFQLEELSRCVSILDIYHEYAEGQGHLDRI
jgi:hypothetical protein